jgi:tRNA G18 (ribose-2'-O)-methylase SpoU
MPVTVILEDLRSAFNVGSIIRTADCARIEKVVFCGYTAHPPNQKLEKTSLGALPYTRWERRPDALGAVTGMQQAGIPVAALELTDKSRWIWDFSFPLPVALVLGNEALGVSQEVLRRSDFIIEIPMLGYKNSINVAVAFGICVYEIQRQYWRDIRQANEIPLRSLKYKKETG